MNKMQFLRQIIIIDASPFIRRKEEMHYLVLYVERVRSEKKTALAYSSNRKPKVN